jgi:dihydrofolate reductase
MYEIIAAAETSSYGIGKDGSLPWSYHKEDMEFFKEKTNGAIVIMGRITWESLP